MILSIQNISKVFGEKVILNNISFHLEDHEKAALIGINGAGKSTLFKIITGELPADVGNIVIPSGKRIGYLAQYQNISSHNSILEELMDAKKELIDIEHKMRELEKKISQGSPDETVLNQYANLSARFERENGYAIQSEVTGILKGLGFEENEFEKRIDTLSGGQKTRVALGKLLLNKPDLLLLDEPINHLDMNSIIWLENYLKNYPGAVLIVAHDRYFLNRTVSKIVEIEANESYVYKGTYSDYAMKKEKRRMELLKAYLKQQQEIKHQEEVITKLKSFNREKSIKRAESREKALNKIERIEKPRDIHDEMNIALEPCFISGNDVLEVSNLTKSFPGLPLFSDVSFDIKRGEHVAIIGDNGTGKTTMLKIFNGMLPSDRGFFTLGANVEIGYYDQEQQVLDPDKNLFQEISDAYPYLDNTQIRSTLAAFLFTGDDVFKMIRDLSGGEKGRVSLAKLMLSEANFLILDEPTNHLDMTSKEILEKAINSYTGTVLYVSHDRYFVNHTAHRILELEGNRILNYIGNYDYYLEKKEAVHNAAGLDSAQDAAVKEATDTKKDWMARKEEQARIRKQQNAIKKIEDEIEALETRSREIDEELSIPSVASNASKCITLLQEKKSVDADLETLMEKWESLQ